LFILFFFSSRRRHTRFSRDWSSDVCSSDLPQIVISGTNEACAGNIVTFTASGANTYTWNTNANTATSTFTAAGASYTAIVIGTRSEERRVGKECWSRPSPSAVQK